MDHPMLSIHEFAEYFRRQAQGCELERSDLTSSELMRLIPRDACRSNEPTRESSYGPSSRMVEHAWG